MSKPFSVTISRLNPYPAYRYLVYFGSDTDPVAGVSKVSALKRTSDVIEYKSGGDLVIRKGLGRTKYDPITLERGITQDSGFRDWADQAQHMDQGSASASLKNLRRELRITLLNEAGQPVHQYLVHRAWVSEFQALGDLDAGTSAVAIEHIKIENEGWEHDPSVTEPTEI